VLVNDQTTHLFTQQIGIVSPDRSTAEEDAVRSVSVGQSSTLQVRAIAITGAGLQVRFNQEFDVRALLAGTDLGSFIVVLRDNVPVKGRVAISPDGQGFIFIAEGAALPDGPYTVQLRSGSQGFTNLDGEPLDGDGDGRAGGDFRGRFDVTSGALHLGLNDTGESAGRVVVRSPDSIIEQPGDIDWVSQRWAVEPNRAASSDSIVLESRVGGLVALSALPALFDKSLLRRALAAGRRRREAGEPININLRVPLADPSAVERSPGWVAHWLGQRRVKGNTWRIRL
jgi:hypothetical protein